MMLKLLVVVLLVSAVFVSPARRQLLSEEEVELEVTKDAKPAFARSSVSFCDAQCECDGVGVFN